MKVSIDLMIEDNKEIIDAIEQKVLKAIKITDIALSEAIEENIKQSIESMFDNGEFDDTIQGVIAEYLEKNFKDKFQ